MSRIGKKEIQLPNGVEVKVENGGTFGYKKVVVKGPKGTLEQSIQRGVDVVVAEGNVSVTRASDSKQDRAFHGLYRTLIDNMIDGVVNGYKKELEIVGIGYRAEVQGDKLVLSVGYSHKINYVAPAGITLGVTDQVNISVEGADKQLVGEVAAKIRAYRKPEPYKGKGIRYKGEKIRKKSTKGAAK
jgi:large subunit ribosomal protein L6